MPHTLTCVCCDPACPYCGERHQVDTSGRSVPSWTCGEPAAVLLRRDDMDPAPMPFCDGCTPDALDSGLFSVVGKVRR